ncbi:hypothetical protein GQ457_07G023940 [Hibiscus cannabinus]
MSRLAVVLARRRDHPPNLKFPDVSRFSDSILQNSIPGFCLSIACLIFADSFFSFSVFVTIYQPLLQSGRFFTVFKGKKSRQTAP